MTEEKQYWTIDELVSLTDTVQKEEVEHQGKYMPVQWCELVESEEPKMDLPEDIPEEEKTAMYMELGRKRTLAMINKANEKNPDDAILDEEVWEKLPSTLKYKIQNVMLGAPNEDFRVG